MCTSNINKLKIEESLIACEQKIYALRPRPVLLYSSITFTVSVPTIT